MKKLIVVTSPHFLPLEEELIVATLDAGAHYVHIRKPHAATNEVERLLCSIPQEYHSRIALHEAHTLAQRYAIGGIHLNSRNPQVPSWWSGRVSCSCHSIDEVLTYKEHCDYIFLSPIHNSISKVGYNTPFTHSQLIEARDRGVIDHRVIALGGITTDNIAYTMQYGFGGIGVMGHLWNSLTKNNLKDIIKQLKDRLLCCNS